MKLNQLSDNAGARKTSTRVGRGIGSGIGKTSGRGVKGQKARNTVMPGFEGGQMPLYRRLPIRGFNNYNFRTNYVEFNVGDLQALVSSGKVDGSKAITLEVLQKAGVTKKTMSGLKLLGNGEVTSKLNIEVAAATKSAMEKISKAGGKVTVKPMSEGIKKFLPKSALKKMQQA